MRAENGIKASRVDEPTPSGTGIVFDGTEGTVYGDVTLQEDLEIGEGESLTIGDGASLNTGSHEVIVNGGTLTGGDKITGTVKYAPTITTESLPNGTVNEEYSQTLAATGSDTITWSIESGGTLPTGLSLNGSTGAITGTPTAVGTYNFNRYTYSSYGSDSKELSITISAATSVSVTGVTLNKTSTELTVGQSETLTAAVEPSNATNKNVTWSSSAESVATVEDGKVTAVGAGEATITVTTEDGNKTAQCAVTVRTPSSTGGGSSSPARYTITVPDDIEGGTVKASPTRASRGTTVTLTVTPDEGYQLDRLTVRDADGDRIDLERVSDSRFTFEMPRSKVIVEAVFTKIEPEPEPLPFADVPEGHWAYEAIRYVWENGLMAGTSAAAFGPDDSLTRGQLVTILWRAAGSPQVNYLMDFSDVDPAAWYGEAVRWASALRIAGGYGDGRFGPDDPVTREQLAVMLYQYAWNAGYDLTGGGMALREFDDYDQISPWALEALDWAVNAGILSGTGDSTLAPQGQATRAQAAVMLTRLCELDR